MSLRAIGNHEHTGGEYIHGNGNGCRGVAADRVPGVDRALACAILAALAACGDNDYPDGEPLAPATDLTIVAHEDDDLLFMQPDLDEAILRGTGVTTVYVTAGDGGRGYGKAEDRYEGLKAAYGALVGNFDWVCGWIERDGHPLEHCRLAAAQLSLVFVGYPDGGRTANLGHGLLQLWQGAVASATTVARRWTTYDRDQLIALIAHVIDDTAPTTLRTLDLAGHRGAHPEDYPDHPDHVLAGALALVATAASSRSPELIAYRGYSNADEPANSGAATLARSLRRLAYYEACGTGCAPCGDACAKDRIPPTHVTYQSRRYAIGMRRGEQGQLQTGERCLDAADLPMLADCATAPAWQLDARGALRTSTGRCLQVQPDGAVTSATCGEVAAGDRWFFDDDGHLWTGVVPPPEQVTTAAHLWCLSADDDRPHARICSNDNAPRWELARAVTVTPRDGRPAPERSLTQWTADLDGDRQLDACEARAAGPACQLARNGTLAESAPWGYSLAGRVEGSDDDGEAADTRTSVLADIDGDGRADLCTARDGVIACARSLGRSFAPRAVIAHLPSGLVATVLWAEADGRLCAADAVTVACTAAQRSSIDTPSTSWPG